MVTPNSPRCVQATKRKEKERGGALYAYQCTGEIKGRQKKKGLREEREREEDNGKDKEREGKDERGSHLPAFSIFHDTRPSRGPRPYKRENGKYSRVVCAWDAL